MRAYAGHACKSDTQACKLTQQKRACRWIKDNNHKRVQQKSQRLFKTTLTVNRHTRLEPKRKVCWVTAALYEYKSVPYRFDFISLRRECYVFRFVHRVRAEQRLCSEYPWRDICLTAFSLPFSDQSSYPVWEDFSAKATKLHSQLR